MPGMHEMSLASSLLGIVREEMAKHGAERLLLVRVCHGALANVVPEALLMAFEVQVQGTDFENARLELTAEPVRLACGACGREFEPQGSSLSRFAPCPHCNEDFGHQVLSGKSLYIEHIEVE